MASYGKIYQFHVESINGADIVIVLLKKGYSGVMQKRALGRSPLLRQDSSGCVQGTSLEIYAEAAVDAEYAEMYTSLADEYRAEVYKNNSLIWVGFVTPELYSEPDLAPPYDVQIVATDGLGELKNYTFGKAGIDSLDEHLSYILSHTGLSLEYMMTSQLSYIDSNGITVSGIDLLTMRVDLSHLHSESCYDALQLILSSINARITQRDGKWFIYRETDMVGLATESGLYTQTNNGNSGYLNIADFGSLERCSWWPVGNLSSVVEPAKNRIEVTSENHYKNNILNSRGWETANTAYYSEPDGAYILPAAEGSIKQRINFDTEFGNRLLLSVKARNVGSGDEDQALGVEVSIYGRTYQGQKQYWLIQPAESDRGVAAYIWRDREAAIEADLDVPSDSDTEGDAQDIEIILPLYSKDSRSYVYAEWVEVRLFSPTGPHDIYVYDCSLSLYDRRKGWQTSAKIDNVAREEAKSVDVTFTDAQTAPVSADEVMTGIPLDIYDEIVKMWKVGNQDPADYLSVITRDNAMAVALPRIKYTGILNVPNENIPYLFLRDERLYSIESYSYDLINDELEIELLGIPVADIEITQSTNPIESGSSSSGTSPGSGSSGGTGSGGSSSLAGLQDVSLTNLAEGQLLIREGNKWVNRTIQEYLDKYNSLGDWFTKIDSVLLTKYNLASEKEVSAKGINQGEGGGGGGSFYSRLDTWDGYDSNKAGYVLSAGLGYGLKVAIDELKGYNLDSRVSAIENAGYTTKTYVDDNFLNKNSGGFVYGLLTAVAGMRLTNTETNIGTLYFGATDGQIIANTDSSILQITSPSIVLKGFTSVDGKLQATDTVTALNDMSVTKGLSVGGWGTFRSGLSVEGGNLVTKYDISVNSGHQIFWTDANSVKHGITYDESAGAFKLDGKFITTGSGASLTWGEISGKPSVLDFSGASSQFLKADGSLDSNTYLTSVSWSQVGGRPTKLSQFTDDVVVGKYLPLTGGTIESEYSDALKIKRTGVAGAATIAFYNSDDGHVGSIGIGGSLSPNGKAPYYSDGSTAYPLWHTGNFNPANYLPLSGGTLTGELTIQSSNLNIHSGNIIFNNSHYLVASGNELAFYNTQWNTLIHSGNVESYNAGGLVEEFLADLNNATGGRFFISDFQAANRPNGAVNYGTGVTFKYSDIGAIYQLAYDTYGGLYSRYKVNNSWSSWKTIAFTDQVLSLDWSNARATTLTSSESLDSYKYGFYSYIDANNPTNYFGNNTALFAFTSGRGIDTWQIAFDGNGIRQSAGPRLGIRGNFAEEGWTSWYQIATTDSNVASATKLQTPRTIWGQSFDGTGDVDGNLTTSGEIFLNHYKAIRMRGSDGISYNVLFTSGTDLLIGYDSPFINFGNSKMLINSSGDVGIGTTTDNASGKLQIAGGVTLNGYMENGTVAKIADLGGKGLVVGAGALRIDWGMALWTEGNGSGFIQQQAFIDAATTYALCLNPFGGNIGIATAYPAYKLDVNGTFRCNCLRTNSTAVTYWGISDEGILSWDTTYASVMAKSGLALRLGIDGTPYITIASNGAISMAGAVTMSSTLSVGGNTTIGGNVGVGTYLPAYRLHVEGTGYFSGALTANGGLTVNGGFAANEGITTTSLVAATITANTSATIAALGVSGLSTLTGGIATNDIHGNGQSLYLGNASNNAYIKVREDMQGSSSMWSIPRDGRATFTSLTTPTLSVTGSATIASVTIEAGTATLRNLTVNTLATLKRLVVGIDGMSCNGVAYFKDFIYSSSIAPDEDNYYVIGTPSKRWFKVNSYDLDLIGTATVNTIKIRSGQSIQFEDSDGSVHTLRYDSTKQAFVFDGNVNATGEMSAKKLNA